MKKLILSTLVIISSFGIRGQQSEQVSKNLNEIKNLLNAAEVSKILADEYFIKGSVSQDTRLYRKANTSYALVISLLDKIRETKSDGELSSSIDSFKEQKHLFMEYLEKDAVYRLTLLSNDLPFYGYESNLIPKNPNSIYSNYSGALKSLIGTYQEIETLFSNISEDDEVISSDQLEKEINTYKTKVNSIKSKSLRNQTDFITRGIEEIKSRRDAYIEEQIEVDNELSANITQIDDAYDAFNNAMTNGIVAAAGIPPEFAGVVRGEPVEKILEKAALEYITGQANDIFQDEIESLSKTYSEAYKVYESANNYKEKFKDVKTTAEQFQKVIAESSVQNLIKIGEEFGRKLEDEIVHKLEGEIKDLTSYVTILKLSDETVNLRNVFAKEILDEYNRRWKRTQEKIIKIIDNSSGDIQSTYKRLVSQYSSIENFNINKTEYKRLVYLVSKVQRDEFAELFANEPETKKLLLSLIKNANAFEIDQNGIVKIKTFPGEVSFNRIIQLPRNNEIIRYEQKAQEKLVTFRNEIEKEIETLKKETKKFIRGLEIKSNSITQQSRIIGSLSDYAIEELLTSMKLGKNDIDQVYRKTIESLDSDLRTSFYKKAMHLQLGGKVVARSEAPIKYKDTIFNRNEFEKGTPKVNSVEKQVAQKLITGALFGGYGAAYEGVKNIIESNNKIDELLEKHNYLNKKSEKITSLIVQLEDQESKAFNNLGIAKAKYEAVKVLNKALDFKI